MILLLKIDKCMFPKVAQELQKENDPLTLFSIVIWEYPSPFPTGLLCFSGGERKPREGKQISQGHRAESSNHYLGTQIIQHSDCNVGIKKSFPFITYCKVLKALYTFSH